MISKNKTIISNYEKINYSINIDIISSGRYFFNSFSYIKYLSNDIKTKLCLTSTDNLLDIGCNLGIYHKYLYKNVNSILGLDAGFGIIEKANNRNNLQNVRYKVLDVLDYDWRVVEKKYNKALVYSVIHFFNKTEDLKYFLTKLLTVLDNNPIIFIGEVRDKELYENYLNKNKNITRNIFFKINKIINKILFKGNQIHLDTINQITVYDFEEVRQICKSLGLLCERIIQEKKHPFYNTCVDYLIYKNNETI